MTTALTDDIMERLRGDGVTSRYVAERLGVGIRTAAVLLKASGATLDHSSRYRIPSLERNQRGWARMEKPVTPALDRGHR